MVAQVQAGRSDKQIYRIRDDGFIDVNELFRLTVPEKVTQDPVTGVIDIEKAGVAKMRYYMTWAKIDYKAWDLNFDLKVQEFNAKAQHVEVLVKFAQWYLLMVAKLFGDI